MNASTREVLHFFNETVLQIRQDWKSCTYDHEPFIQDIPDLGEWRSESMRRDYAAFKYTVAAVLRPQRIVEVGVGFGVAACAFLSASGQGCSYVGYDDGSMDKRSVAAAKESLGNFRNTTLREIESSSLTSLPDCDLCHVDGAHDYGHAYRDTQNALRSARWVLVDDCRDSQVAAATLQALYLWRPGDVFWHYFQDTLNGDILIFTKRTG